MAAIRDSEKDTHIAIAVTVEPARIRGTVINAGNAKVLWIVGAGVDVFVEGEWD